MWHVVKYLWIETSIKNISSVTLSVRCTARWLPSVEDSPGCPSPTDSDVNMKEPSSGRSLIFATGPGTQAKTQRSQGGKKRRFLCSHQQVLQRALKAALYSCWYSLREKWRKGGQQPCSQHRVYPTKLHVCVHMAQYIWLREDTRAHTLSLSLSHTHTHTHTHASTHTHTHSHTHTHTRHVNPWDSPFQGGVDDGRAFQLVEAAC